MQFAEALEYGKKVEEQVLYCIQKKYPSATIINKFKGYDIWIPETNFGIEVKCDQKSMETGNIVIEFEFNGKPSAILTTTAKYWVFYDGFKFIWLTPQQIINCVFQSKQHYVSFIGNGDKASKKAYLIKKTELEKYAISEQNI